MTSSPKPELSSLRINRDAPTASYRGRSRSTFLIWTIAVAVILAVIAYVVWGMRGVAVVETASVQRLNPASAQSLLTATGYVVAQRKADVASKGTGRLEVLNVEEGDRVKAGDVLARLESVDVEAAYRSARAGVGQAEAELERAQAIAHEAALNFNRVRDLRAKNLVSDAELETAEARSVSARAGVTAADAALRTARADAEYAAVQVENTYIRAPFDGTVLTKNADVGEVVAPFASSVSSKGAVVTLADMSSLEVEADVSESNIQRIQSGQPCIIVLDALPTEPYRGRVKKIVPTADRAKATVLTKITFDELDNRVLPEMSAKVSFLPAGAETSTLENRSVISAPLATLADRRGRKVVFIVRQGRVTETPVETGETYGGAIEIRAGVEIGDVLVLRPPAGMRDGDRVELRK